MSPPDSSADYNRDVYVLHAAVLLVFLILVAYSGLLERIDFIIYDNLSTVRQYPRDENIVIVSIDEESLGTLGRWPWSRRVHAELINRLATVNTRAVAVDLLFSEPEKIDPEADLLLASAIKQHGNIIFPVAPASGAAPDTLFQIQPMPLFTQDSALAHTDIELDSDGVARRVFLYAGMDVPTWPALGFAMADATLAKRTRYWDNENTGVATDDRQWVRSTEVLIAYAGPPGSFRCIPYVKVLLDDAVLASLADKTVIVGMAAAGTGTHFATPVSPSSHQAMTGVEWHANVFSTMTGHRAVYPVAMTVMIFIPVIWVGTILVTVLRSGRNLTLPVLLVLLVVGLLLCYLMLDQAHLWFPPSVTLLGTLLLYPLANWQRINHSLHALQVTKARSSTVLESVDDAVIITDDKDHVIYINRGAEKILQAPAWQIQGKSLKEVLVLSDSHPGFTGLVKPETASDDTSSAKDQYGMAEYRLLKAVHGHERTVRITRNQLLDDAGSMTGTVVTMTDVSDTVKLAKQVAHQKSHDALTKLPNRSMLLARFDDMISDAGKEGHPGKSVTVFFITLDNFKKINDAMGNHAGDKLLVMVASRLSGVARKEDIVARWGGDEFVLLAGCLYKEYLVFEMAEMILNTMRQRFQIDDMEVFVSASIGVSSYPEDGLTSEVVLKKAGTAMYRIKEDGGNQFGFYSAELSDSWTRDQLEMEKELRNAIGQRELQVFYQPIIHEPSGKISRMEALVRWPHPKRELLAPSAFLPLAENTGQIEQLGELVLYIACTAAARLAKFGHPVSVAVNIHPRQLADRHFPKTVMQVLQDVGLPAKSLILEITENGIVNDMERAASILQQMKSLGILVSLDDFGTGYSSLTLLRELPIDILKIDKSFVYRLGENPNDLKIVQAIIGLGKNLGMTVVAEGVETVWQAEMLLHYGCDYQQGYYFSRPVPYDAFVDLLRDSKEMAKLESNLKHRSASPDYLGDQV